MIVIVHEAIGMAKPIIFLVDPAEDVKKGRAVFILLVDGLPCIAAGSDMVDGAAIFDT
jgi:hypothetical protein